MACVSKKTVRAHKAFRLAFVDCLNDRQRASMMLVAGNADRHERTVRIKENLHFLRNLPVSAVILFPGFVATS